MSNVPHHDRWLAHMGEELAGTREIRLALRAIDIPGKLLLCVFDPRPAWLCRMRTTDIKESGARAPDLANCVSDLCCYENPTMHPFRFVLADLGVENAGD